MRVTTDPAKLTNLVYQDKSTTVEVVPLDMNRIIPMPFPFYQLSSVPEYQAYQRTSVPEYQRSSIPLARDVLTVSELQQGHQLGKLKLIMGTFAGVFFAGDDLTVPELHQDHPHGCFLSTSVSAFQRTRVPAY